MDTISCVIAGLALCGFPFALIALISAPPIIKSWEDKGVRETVSEIARRVLGPIVEKAAHTEPLPDWTNAYLIGYAAAIWAFAISLNWLGDNLPYVIVSVSILAAAGLGVFWRVERGRTERR